jgi:hypothetical protein
MEQMIGYNQRPQRGPCRKGVLICTRSDPPRDQQPWGEKRKKERKKRGPSLAHAPSPRNGALPISVWQVDGSYEQLSAFEVGRAAARSGVPDQSDKIALHFFQSRGTRLWRSWAGITVLRAAVWPAGRPLLVSPQGTLSCSVTPRGISRLAFWAVRYRISLFDFIFSLLFLCDGVSRCMGSIYDYCLAGQRDPLPRA